MKREKPTEKLFSKMYILLFVINFVFFIGFYMLMPTLPLYGESLGGTSTQIGAIATAFAVASVIVRFCITFLMDRFGRKTLLFFGVALAFALTLCYPLVRSIYSVILLRTIQGLGFGLVTTFCAAMLADVLPDSRRGEGIGYYGMANSVSFALAPAIGLAFLNTRGFPAMFVAAAVAFAATLLFVYFVRVPDPPARKKVDEHGSPLPKPAWWNRFFDPVITGPCILLLLFGLGRGAEQNFISLLAQSTGLTALSVFFLVQTAMVFIMRLFIGRTYDRHGPAFSAILGGFFVIGGMLLMSLAYNNTILLISAVLSGMGNGTLIPTYQVWIMTGVGAEKRTLGSALYYNTYDIGIAIGAVLYGAIAGRLGYHGMFRVCVYVTVVYLILCLFVRRRRKKRFGHV